MRNGKLSHFARSSILACLPATVFCAYLIAPPADARDAKNSKNQEFPKVTSLLNASKSLRLQGKFKEALAKAEEAKKIEPNSATVMAYRAIPLARLGSISEAQKSLEKAVELDPENGDAWRLLGHFRWARNYQSKAAEAFEKAVKLNPRDASSWYHLGIYYASKNEGDRAKTCMQKAVDISPKDSDYNQGLGYVYHGWNKSDLAEKYYKTALKLDPENWLAVSRYGMLLERLGRKKEAHNLEMKYFRTARKDARKSPWAEKLGKKDFEGDDEEVFASSDNEFLVKNHAFKDLTMESHSRPDEVANDITKLRVAAHRYSKNPEVWHKLVMGASQAQDYGEALNAAQRAYHLDPNSSEHAETLAVALYNAGRKSEADALAAKTESAAIKAKDAEQLNSLANTRFRLSRDLNFRIGAISLWKEAVALTPKSAESVARLGIAQWHCGDRQAGIELVSRAVRLQPTSMYPLILADMYTCVGDKESAVRLKSSFQNLGKQNVAAGVNNWLFWQACLSQEIKSVLANKSSEIKKTEAGALLKIPGARVRQSR